MSNLDFGIVCTVVGMGTTFVTLLFLSYVIDLLKRLFPREAPAPKPAPLKEATDRA